MTLLEEYAINTAVSSVKAQSTEFYSQFLVVIAERLSYHAERPD